MEKNYFLNRPIIILFMALMGMAMYGQVPTVSAFTPGTVTTRTVVTITGTNFTATSSVTFGGIAASSVVFNSSTQITATVAAGSASGNVVVTTASGSGSKSGLVYVSPVATTSSASASNVITTFNGFWNTTGATDVGNQANTRHDLLAYGYNVGGTNVIYSTNVNNSTLTTNGVSYTAGDYRALPIGTISGNTSSGSYLLMGKAIDGNLSTAVSSSVSGIKVRDVLIDGSRGLDLGTGVTNLNSTSVLLFNITSITSGKITDAEPDILVSQIGSINTGDNDIYCFIDVNGNIIGTPVQIDFSTIGDRGTQDFDFFTLPVDESYETATSNSSFTFPSSTRNIKLAALKLSEFGITALNAGQVAKLKFMPGGVSDPGFVAYNAGAMVIPSPIIVTQPTSQVVCPNVNGSATFTVVASGTNLSYQWRKGFDNIIGANSATYTINNVTMADAGTYRVLITNPFGSVLSDPVYLNVVLGFQSSDVTTCLNSPTSVTVTANGLNLTYQWYTNTINNNTTGTIISGATSNTYSPPVNVSGTKYYYCRVRANNQTCTDTYTSPIQVVVNSSVGGTVLDQNICTGSTANLTLSGYTGTIQWQQSANGTTGWADVSGGSGATTSIYTTPTLSSTTYYRAIVTNGSCASSTSNVATVNVSAASNAGTASSNQTICTNSSTTVSVTGHVGSVQWEQSNNGTTGWANVTGGSGATTATYTTPALTAVRYYRAKVTNGACPVATSGTVTINISASSNAGTISSDQTICTNTSTSVSITGSVGSIQWEQSTDGSTGWINVTGGSGATASTYTTPLLTATRYYRAKVTNGSCPLATSNVVTVNVSASSNGGTASSNQTICINSSTSVSVTGSVGSIQWEQSNNGSTGWANVTGGSGATTATYTTPALTTTKYYRAKATSGPCTSAYSSTITVSVNNVNVWTGNAGTDWNDNGNWSCFYIPTLEINVNIPVVPSNNYPKINGGDGIALCKNVTVLSGANMLIEADGILEIGGTILNNGVINATDGEVEMHGTTFQDIPSQTFENNLIKNLTINNPSGVFLDGVLNLTGVLEILSGNFETSNMLTLKSNSGQTAIIAPVFGSITGDMTIERFIPGRRAFRFLASPVDGGSVQDNWQEGLSSTGSFGTDITGTGGSANGFDVSGSNNPSMFTYNNQSLTWLPVTNTVATNLEAGTPYRVLVRGDRTVDQTDNEAPATDTTIRSTGTIKYGDVPVTDLSDVANAFSLIGNPYQAPVDMEQVLGESNNVNPVYYHIWDPTINARGGYVTVNVSNNSNNVGGSDADKFLQPNHGFFVQTIDNGPSSILFKESYKSVDFENPSLYRSGEETYMQISLYDANATNSNTACDGFVINFDSAYSNDLDIYDAKKLTNQDENIASYTMNKRLSFESRNIPTASDTIPIFINQYRKPNYILKIKVNNLSGVDAYLYDRYLGTNNLLDNNEETVFNFSIDTEVPASSASDRFDIVFMESGLGAETHVNNDFALYPNPSKGEEFSVRLSANADTNIKLYNPLGQEMNVSLIRFDNEINVRPTAPLSDGLYVVKIYDGGSWTSKTILIKQ